MPWLYTDRNVLTDVVIPHFGSQSKAAAAMGLTAGELSRRRKKGRTFITAEEAIRVEEATAGELDRSALRPDLWPLEGWSPLPRAGRTADLLSPKAKPAPKLSAITGRQGLELRKHIRAPRKHALPEWADPEFLSAGLADIRAQGFNPADATGTALAKAYTAAASEVLS